jgi:hypothetical protein
MLLLTYALEQVVTRLIELVLWFGASWAASSPKAGISGRAIAGFIVLLLVASYAYRSWTAEDAIWTGIVALGGIAAGLLIARRR